MQYKAVQSSTNQFKAVQCSTKQNTKHYHALQSEELQSKSPTKQHKTVQSSTKYKEVQSSRKQFKAVQFSTNHNIVQLT